jgi:hypothetical protein
VLVVAPAVADVALVPVVALAAAAAVVAGACKAAP